MALNDAVPSSATDVFKRNIEDTDRLLNTTDNVVNRVGVTLESFPNATSRVSDAADAAQIAIQADVDNVDASRISAQSAITSDSDSVEASRIAAELEIANDVSQVNDSEIAAQASIQSDVDSVDASRILAEQTIQDDVDAAKAAAIANYQQWNSRGNWASATAYLVGDIWQNTATSTWYLVLNDYTSGATVNDDITGPNVTVLQGAGIQSFEGLSEAIAKITANPELFSDNSSVSISSNKTKAECVSAGVDFPDGNGGDYVITTGETLVDGRVIAAGTKQLKLITQKLDLPIENVVKLREFEPTVDGQECTLSGHTIAGIGDGNFYAILNDVGGVDNNGTKFMTTGGHSWNRKSLSGIFSEVDFGVLPNVDATEQLKNIGLQSGLKITQTLSEIEITESVVFDDITYDIGGNKIKSIRTDATLPGFAVFSSIKLDNGACMKNGTVYTSGNYAPVAFGSTCLVHQLHGDITNVELFSGVDEILRYERGNLDVMLHGGLTRGIRGVVGVDEARTLNIRFFNLNIPHNDMLVPADVVVPVDARGVHILPTLPIESKWQINVDGEFSWKNAVWIGSPTDGREFENMNTYGNVMRAGYYLNSFGEITDGHGAGTNWEFEGCPDLQAHGDSSLCRGYNIAIFTGCHRAYVGGTHRGDPTAASPFGGDPVAVIARSDDVEVAATLIEGTVGLSVGEDNFAANNCTFTGTIINSGWVPVMLGDAVNFGMVEAKVIGEQRITHFSGLWSRYGQLLPVIRLNNITSFDTPLINQDVRVINCTFDGWFTHLAIDLEGYDRVRIKEERNSYNCPIIPRDIQHKQLFESKQGGASGFLKLLETSPDTGHASTGTFTLANGVGYVLEPIAAALTSLNQFKSPEEADFQESLKQMACVVYVKYVPAMKADTGTIFFGVTPSLNSFRTAGGWIVGTTDDVNTPLILNRDWQDGEWIPVVIPMSDMLGSDVDPVSGAINYFACRHSAFDGLSYDIEITKPVLIYVGRESRNYS